MRQPVLFIVLAAIAGCASDTSEADDPIDRTGFDLDVCPASEPTPFAGLTPSVAVDYLELQSDGFTQSMRGERCSGASDQAACEQAYEDLFAPPDAWQATPGGGAPPPLFYLKFTRGDEVGTIGRSGLGEFLSPIETPFEAAFLAEVTTLGRADCVTSARRLDGGHEVITTTVQACGGRVTETRVLVTDGGSASVVETAVLSAGVEETCG